MSDVERLLKKIELLRHELRNIARNKRFADPEVIAASERLDKVLVQYYKFRDMRFVRKIGVG
ncbi:aspartyl-phosphate phosphatase Spo0E family protein [Desulforamulus aeronauticus]|uniref:aspartyl-phosphate phosphatase Spo0E family protein n=1 Tax=Desulforamulus aeronauticus TaxID=53343 RepID=UPI001114CAB7|nr:aspartyl-phosphate phosphatase Spo0E family protein [Desulforamulus aeronauticus]